MNLLDIKGFGIGNEKNMNRERDSFDPVIVGKNMKNLTYYT
jgi:hypothetical protein